jgi:hypothetical protein
MNTARLYLVDEHPDPDILPLDLIESYLRRFVAYPNEHALVAHVLWIVHTHMIDSFDTTPRLAFMSAEKASGKTRALEVTAEFVPDPIMSISASPACIVRLVSAGRPTILYDEIDGVFGSAKAQEANIDLRSILNGGYRRGAKVYRCNTSGKKIEVEALDAFGPVAVAGLRELPDTLASRSIIIRMKRRAPSEAVEPFRQRYHGEQAKPLKEALVDWCEANPLDGVEPELPSGIEDRAADCWEPMFAIAYAAGGDWPDRTKAAALFFTRSGAKETTPGEELLAHIRDAFGTDEKAWTRTLIERLIQREESPWRDIRGKPLDERGLATRLKPYGLKSKDVWIAGTTKKGYHAADFSDVWGRYLPPSTMGDEGDEREEIDNKDKNLADLADLAEGGPPLEQDDNDPFAGLKDPNLKLRD